MQNQKIKFFLFCFLHTKSSIPVYGTIVPGQRVDQSIIDYYSLRLVFHLAKKRVAVNEIRTRAGNPNRFLGDRLNRSAITAD